MRRERIQFERFTSTLFFMDAGEERKFTPYELSRGLTTHWSIANELAKYSDAIPMHAIPIYHKGPFAILRGDLPPDIRTLPTTAPMVARFPENYRVRALADNCEYHCLTSRADPPIYWQREIIIETEQFRVNPQEFIYLAQGEIQISGHRFAGPAMIEIENTNVAKVTSPVFGLRIWE